jgi:ABC-2 type transport system permease protein
MTTEATTQTEETTSRADGPGGGNGPTGRRDVDMDEIRQRARTRISETVETAKGDGWYGAWTLFTKEMDRFWGVASQTIISPVITTLLYFLVFGYSLKDRLREIQGVPYVDFLVPGLVMLTLINNSFVNSAFSFFITKIHGIIVDILVTPLSPVQLTVGYTAASIVRGLVVGGLIWAIAAAMGAGTIHAPLVTVGFMFVTALAFASLGVMIAVIAEDFDHINLLPNFLITPLTFLGGVFYSIEMLPAPWDTVSLFNPVLYVVNGLRYGMTGYSDVPLWQAYAVVGTMCVVFSVGAVWLLSTGKKIRE